MNYEEFRFAVSELGVILTDKQIHEYKVYAQLLKEWNNVMDLTAICEEEAIIEKHFYDSLLSVRNVKYDCQKILDIGSGAGFPGLVLKIAFPSLRMTLLEPTSKRVKFLNEVINVLNLKDVHAVNLRAEEFIEGNRELFDLVTARAVSKLNILLELAIPFLKVNGKFIALKGSKVEEEIKEAKNALSILSARIITNISEKLITESDNRSILIIEKTNNTLIKYPRNYGTIKKKPL